MCIFETNSPEETKALAFKFADILKVKDVITLDGDLGAGKTVFSKGLAKGLGIEDEITSPTFIIVQEYKEGRLPLYHFDVYRIEDEEEIIAIGADEYIEGDGVCLIEWASMIEGLIPENAIRITINTEPEKGFDYRKITVEGLDKEREAFLI